MKHFLFAVCMILSTTLFAESFASKVGDVSVGEVKAGTYQVPYILWGGEYPTIFANGGLETKTGSIFQKQGLSLKMVPGDDFHQQVRDYLSGKSPFLRGTLGMFGQASELINKDPRTKGVYILQMTFSQGDHCVSTEEFKNLEDLKRIAQTRKIKVALQEGGPHVGMLDDLIQLTKLNWNNFEIVWTKDLFGTPNSPASVFSDRSKSIDLCFAVTPDMVTLCGGIDSVGDKSGADGNVPGAHVLLSTATMNKSIVDGYLVRSDFLKSNRDSVEQFVAGYLRCSDEVGKLQKAFEENKSSEGGKQYLALLKQAQQIYTPKVLPDIELDAGGLWLDCDPVGIDGNISFFKDEGNLQNFARKSKSALALAVTLGYSSVESPIEVANFDYKKISELSGVKYREPQMAPKFNSEVEILPNQDIGDKLDSFTVQFSANQTDFPIEQYQDQFDQVVQNASLLGNSRFVIRGHTDPSLTLYVLIEAGKKKGAIKVSGSGDSKSYFYNGKRLDIDSTKELCGLIENGAFDGVKISVKHGDGSFSEHEARSTMIDALQTSRARAENVRKKVLEFAKSKGLNLDESQIQIQGVGIQEPLISRPKTVKDMAENRRVEFAVIKAQAETSDASVLDY